MELGHSRAAAISKAISIVVIIVILVTAGVAFFAFSSSSPNEVSITSVSKPSSTLTASATSSVSSISGTATSLQKVTFLLSFVPTEFSTVYYYGLDQGIFAKYGIDLTIQPSSGAATAVSLLSAGKAQFAEADPLILTILTAKQNVTNVRFIAVMHKQSPFAIIYNKAVVNKLSDLNGKSEGNFQGSANQPIFEVLCKLNNINYSSLKIVYASPSQVNTLVATGKTDFVLQTINAYATTSALASPNGIQLGYFRFADYGIVTYGQGIMTTTDVIQNNPALAKSFVSAMMESLVATAHNPDAAINALLKHNPQLDLVKSRLGFNILLANDFPNINGTAYQSKPLTWGWIDSSVIQNTLTLAQQSSNVSPPPASQIYTNQFVQQPSAP